MSDHISDALEMVISAIIFAAAISAFLIMLSALNAGITLSAQNIDEKQSVKKQINTDIDTTPSNRTVIKYNASQVYSNIIAVDPDATVVTVDGTTVPAALIKEAQAGDERSIKKLRNNYITEHRYERANVFDHDDVKGDTLCNINFTHTS